MAKLQRRLLCGVFASMALASHAAEHRAHPDAAGALALPEVSGLRVESGVESLIVSWDRVYEADRYRVQWRERREEYHRRREQLVRDTEYTITRLEPRVLHYVRVIATARGMADGPHSIERTGRPLPVPPNEPPEAIGTLPALRLAIGQTATVELSSRFSDPHDDRLYYSAKAADPNKATTKVDLNTGMLTVTGRWHGETTISATATDRGDLSATHSFVVAVGNLLEFVQRDYSAAEGRSLAPIARLTASRSVDTLIEYTIGVDDDPATADADAGDFQSLTGTATLAAGRTAVTMDIPVYDDARIEPTREHLVVTLQDGDPSADYAVRPSMRQVAAVIDEGVCDRTPGVREGIRAWRSCHNVTADVLAVRQTLDIQGRGIESLQPHDFNGLSGLNALLLNENRLTELPEGIFEGLGNLRQLHLHDNPGAPFALTVFPFRTNAPLSAPHPAWVAAGVREAAPFPMLVNLVFEYAARPSVQTTVETGALRGESSLVRARSDVVRVAVAKPPTVPSTRCGSRPRVRCYQGIETVGGSLALFKKPPRQTATIVDQHLALAGDSVWIDLSGFFAAVDASVLTFSARTSAPALATVRVVGDRLIITANEDGTEGRFAVTVTATDVDGASVDAVFEGSVELTTRGFLRGWRLSLAPGAATERAGGSP